jgi:hypothetical protein
MFHFSSSVSLRGAGFPAALGFLLFGLAPVPVAFSVEKTLAASLPPRIQAFQPGESLTYDVSWSNRVKAGSAVMEVKGERLPNGREVLRFVVTSRTVGAVGKLYPLGDSVQSVFDPSIMQSLSYSLRESHGRKTRRKDMAFDHVNRTVTIQLNNDPLKTQAIPDRVQDNLSSLYYLRTREDFIIGKPITFEAFDSGNSVAVEVQTLGREQVNTPAGAFATIKVRAYKGLFMSDGEIFVWLTDDARKVPVLIQGRLKIGTIVFTLAELKPGRN